MELRKKEFLKSMLLLAVCLIGLAWVTYFMSVPYNVIKIKAQQGAADLSGVRLSDKIADLQGEWAFYFGKLLTPQELDGQKAAYLPVPAQWSRYGYPRDGAATYHVTVRTAGKERLTLSIPWLSDAAKVWVNGDLAYSYGQTGLTAQTSVTGGKRTFYTFTTQNNRADIVVQLSKFHYYQSGLTSTFRLGREDVVKSDFTRRFMLYTFCLGFLFVFALYHLMLYLHRREKLYLVFSLACLLIFVRFVFENAGITSYFEVFTQKIRNDIYFIAYFLYNYLMFYFALLLTGSRALRHPLIRWHILPILTTVFSLTTSPHDLMRLVLGLCLYGPTLYTISIVLIWRSPERKRNYHLTLYAITFAVFIVLGLTYRMLLVDSYFMLGMNSFLLMVTVQSLMMSSRYVEAYRQVETINAELEDRVVRRTQELQSLNEQLEVTNEQLTVSQTAIRELLVNISHDLKTPLTVLDLNLQSLLSDRIRLTDAERQSCLNVAYNKNLTISRLIKNLFDLTRIETGQLSYQPEWIELETLMDMAYDKYADYVQSMGLQFSISCEESGAVLTDADKIWSVFDNIIYNAVRYTPQGGSIQIHVQRTADGMAEFRITDTGCGIAPEHVPHLFDRFYKVSRARSEKDGEGGVGLYIVKSAVEGSGGRVWAESAVGQGTSIVFALQAQPEYTA